MSTDFDGCSAAFAAAIFLSFPWAIAVAFGFTPRGLFAIAWLGVFGSGLAYLCFYYLHARWGATRSSLVAYLLPVVGIVAGALVLGETIDARIVLGTALIVSGVGLVNATVDFIDADTGKTLASGVKVSAVAGTLTGTAKIGRAHV